MLMKKVIGKILNILINFFGALIKPGSLTISALFETLMRENRTFSNILQNVKTLFLPISIILRLIPIEIPKKYKTEVLLMSTALVKSCSRPVMLPFYLAILEVYRIPNRAL